MGREDRPTEDFERIEPASFGREDAAVGSGDGGAPAPGPGGGPGPRGLGGVLVAALVVIAIGTFVWLPERVRPLAVSDRPEDPQQRAEPDPSRSANGEPASGAPPSVDVEQLLDARERAEGLAARLETAIATLEARSIERWAPGDHETLLASRERAAERFETRAYAEAADLRSEAIARAEQLVEDSRRRRAEAIEQGTTALADGDAAVATEAFELARAIEPGADADRGLARAAVVDTVRAHVRAGRVHETAGHLEQARDAYRAAVDLDAATTDASEALERVETAITDRMFRKHVSDGLAALDDGSPERARAAFREAAALRPGAPEVRDGLARASAELTTRRIARLRDRAAEHERAERWAEVVATYDEVLALDATLAFAQEGLERARPLAAFHARIDAALARPERLADAAAREEAVALLEQARSITPGPVLRERVNRLARALAAATRPVVVELRSDDATEVILYKVGNLGSFGRRELELLPGRYTVVGRRRGYRDARHSFEVPAGAERVGPIDVRARERL